MRVMCFLMFSDVLFSTSTRAQAVLLKNFPNIRVAVKVEVPGHRFSSSDSVQLKITLTSQSDTVQEILFDKPYTKVAPWSTSTSIKNSSGKSMVEFENRELLSSTLYTEDELRKKGYYEKLNPKQSVSHSYYLRDLPILNTRDGKLSKGKYTLQLNYYGNQSNEISFAIQ